MDYLYCHRFVKELISRKITEINDKYSVFYQKCFLEKIGYLRDSQNSLLWTEVVFTFGDIFKFVNDRAYEQAFQTTRYVETDQIEKLLAFLDTAELLLEVGSSLVGGHTAKWIVISTVQILK